MTQTQSWGPLLRGATKFGWRFCQPQTTNQAITERQHKLLLTYLDLKNGSEWFLKGVNESSLTV